MYINTSNGLLRNLTSDRIKINWNKNPIEMKLFLSFLTVKVEKIRDHFGSDTGWTRYENKEKKLVIGGGCVNGVEWLDSLEYRERLSNSFNNFVNPFYLWDILTDAGKKFFLEYYADEIEAVKHRAAHNIEAAQEQLKKATEHLSNIEKELAELAQ